MGLNFTLHIRQRHGIDFSRSFSHPFLEVVSIATSLEWYAATSFVEEYGLCLSQIDVALGSRECRR